MNTSKDIQQPQGNNANRVLATVKIGIIEYKVQDGDYILFNGSCHQFCAGDGRILKSKGWDRYSHLVIPKAMVKKIPFDKLKKEEYKSNYVKGGVKWLL